MSPAPPTTKGRKIRKINAIAQAKLISLMIDGLLSPMALSAETGLHYVTVLQYTRELWLAGAAYIDHFEADTRGRDVIKIYKIGRGKDAKRHRYTPAEKSQRYRTAKHTLDAQRAMTLHASIAKGNLVDVGSEI